MCTNLSRQPPNRATWPHCVHRAAPGHQRGPCDFFWYCSHPPARVQVMAARLRLLERPRTPLPFQAGEEPPNAALRHHAATGPSHGPPACRAHPAVAALSRTPLAGILAQNSHDYLAAWALLGTWTCTLVWPTPECAKWPKACLAVNEQLQERKPYLGTWGLGPQQLRTGCTLCPCSHVLPPGPLCGNPRRRVLPVSWRWSLCCLPTAGCSSTRHSLLRQ